MDKTYRCCICHKEFTGYGNDPWPIDTRDDVKCCDNCNFQVVVPERLRGMLRGGEYIINENHRLL